MRSELEPFTRHDLGHGRERLVVLGPGGWPLVVECGARVGLARLRVAARTAGVDWLHGLARTRRVEGGFALVGAEGPRPRQVLRLRAGAEGVDVERVRVASERLLAAERVDTATRAAFERALSAAGVELPSGAADGPARDGRTRGARRPGASPARAATAEAWRARARALLDGVQAVGDDHATEWIPRFAATRAADPAHLWLRPGLGFTAARPERDFCTTHPTPAEVGVLGLPEEWSTAVRAGGRRRRLRVGVLLHPGGLSLVLLEPDGADLAVVVRSAEGDAWLLYDRDDYRAAYLDRRRPMPKDARRW